MQRLTRFSVTPLPNSSSYRALVQCQFNFPAKAAGKRYLLRKNMQASRHAAPVARPCNLCPVATKILRPARSVSEDRFSIRQLPVRQTPARQLPVRQRRLTTTHCSAIGVLPIHLRAVLGAGCLTGSVLKNLNRLNRNRQQVLAIREECSETFRHLVMLRRIQIRPIQITTT